MTPLASDVDVYVSITVKSWRARETGKISVVTSRSHTRQCELMVASIKHLWMTEYNRDLSQRKSPELFSRKWNLFYLWGQVDSVRDCSSPCLSWNNGCNLRASYIRPLGMKLALAILVFVSSVIVNSSLSQCPLFYILYFYSCFPPATVSKINFYVSFLFPQFRQTKFYFFRSINCNAHTTTRLTYDTTCKHCIL
jgi:hypothetical protein